MKTEFTKTWSAAAPVRAVSAGRARDGRRGVWQPKYWEHTIRDADDLEHHVDYIHYNPVRHGYVTAARDWPWSTFHRWVAAGAYPADWGTAEPMLPWDRLARTTGE